MVAFCGIRSSHEHNFSFVPGVVVYVWGAVMLCTVGFSTRSSFDQSFGSVTCFFGKRPLCSYALNNVMLIHPT